MENNLLTTKKYDFAPGLSETLDLRNSLVNDVRNYQPNVAEQQNNFRFATDMGQIEPNLTKVDPNNSVPGFTFADNNQTQTPNLPQQPNIPQQQETTGNQTIAQSLQDAMVQAQSISDSLKANNPSVVLPSAVTQQSQYAPFDEQKARQEAQRNQLSLYQAQIDAVNQIADQELARARLEQTGRLGSQRAIGARGGILGSDFATAQKEKVQDYGAGIEQGIQAERAAKIGSILGSVRNSVANEIAEKRAARERGASEYLKFLSEADTRKQANINNFTNALLSQGINVNELSQEELDTFARETGVSTKDMVVAYNIAENNQKSAAKGKNYTLKQGERLVDSSGNVIAEGSDKPVVLKEGDTILNSDGTTRKIAKTAQPKSSNSNDKLYNDKTVPGTLRSNVIDQLSNPKGEITLADLALTYPEISEGTLQTMLDKYYTPQEIVSGNSVDNEKFVDKFINFFK